MPSSGLSLCCRYSYPPNSFSLCGPEKQNDLRSYTATQEVDNGTVEILSEFSTLSAYLSFIAYENNLKDAYDLRVVEAYWEGNSLLKNIAIRPYVDHLAYKLSLKKKLTHKELESLNLKIEHGALPHHSFHVLNVYKRTGNMDSLHTLQSMDACIINYGQVTKIYSDKITLETNPLTVSGNKLVFGKTRLRTILSQGHDDLLMKSIKTGDIVSYHWGYFCRKLNQVQAGNLKFFTQLSINFANTTL